MAIVYRHIRLDLNKPFYIGIGKKEFRAYVTKGRSVFWNNIVNKTPYEVEILIDNLTWEQAKEKEKEFIQLYGRIDLGLGTLVNLTDGGDGLNNPSGCTRNRMSEKQRQKRLSQEQKQAQSERMKKLPVHIKPNPEKAKETRKINKQLHKELGIPYGAEKVIGRKRSNETRQLQSQKAKAREKTQNQKEVWSDLYKKANEVTSKPVLQFTMDNILVTEFKSLSEAIRQTKINTLGDCARGRQKSAGGYKWTFKQT